MSKKIIKFYASEKADVNEEKRTIESYASTNMVDRDGEKVLSTGIDLTNFKSNPVVCFNHITWSDKVTVIGKSIEQEADENGLRVVTEFAKTPLASEVYELNRDGFLKSWSIGFMILEKEMVESVRTFTKTELLEYSSVIIPANTGAVNLSFIKSLKSDELKETFASKYLIESVDTEIKRLKETIEELKNIEAPKIDIDALVREELEKRIKELQPKFKFLEDEITGIKLEKQRQDIYKSFVEMARNTK